MTLRFHEIAEVGHRILNPFTDEQLRLLGRICGLQPGMRQLDLACGKGEMLCRWAAEHGIGGVGVDISEVFLAAAAARAAELNVSDRVTFVRGDAGEHEAAPGTFDVVSCIGATWIGDGVIGTLELMKPALKPGGLLLVGEPYWIDPPPPEALEAVGAGEEDFTSLGGTLDRFEQAGTELVEMVLADPDSWDRYVAAQWLQVRRWLQANPADPEADDLRDWLQRGRRGYMDCSRRYFGWGVFVLQVT